MFWHFKLVSQWLKTTYNKKQKEKKKKGQKRREKSQQKQKQILFPIIYYFDLHSSYT